MLDTNLINVFFDGVDVHYQEASCLTEFVSLGLSASHAVENIAGNWKVDRAGSSWRAMAIDVCKLSSCFVASFWFFWPESRSVRCQLCAVQ
jgi:hypothetical protein